MFPFYKSFYEKKKTGDICLKNIFLSF